MTWLILAAAIEIGWMPMGDFIMYDPPAIVTVTGSFYVDMEARVTAFGFLFVGGQVRTFIWSTKEDYTFTPERMLYQFNAGVNWGSVEIGFRHFCTHPVWAYLWSYHTYDRNYGHGASWEGSYEEVYLRLETP